MKATGRLKRTDVCIVGGGIAGTALAAAISQSPFASGLKVTLIEGGNLFTKPEHRPGIGAWDRIPVDRKKVFTQMKIWDAMGYGKLGFNAPQTNASSCIGWIVESNWLRYAVAQSVDQKSVSILNNETVESVTRPAAPDEQNLEWPVVVLKDASRIQSRLLVGADGANSLVRKFAGIDALGWEYPQKAIVATLDLEGVEGKENDIAYQKFLPGGPIAILPLSATKSSLVWSTTPANAAKLSKLTNSNFANFVDIAFRNSVEDIQFLFSQINEQDGSLPQNINIEKEAEWGRNRLLDPNYDGTGLPPTYTILPKIAGVVEGSRAGFPLRFWHSENYIGSDGRIALIGDAAHTIHPLAGQGLNLGLLDVATLSKVIDEGVISGSDVGNLHTLQNYAAERFAPNLAMMMAVDSVGKLFRTESDLIVWARSFGLNLVNSLPAVKNMAMFAASSL
ncbi:putative ubiquinone biosynthesis monooxygenase [Physocladia obscura]|uniref:Ubiquinone biosynthesis monooxygenase n=1 Tax=Physocladia obscura TaxID=109957 RepID=A0AAD5STZ1_9FUNG|nr:putative ubiquinone biosynthesis monooxygenase [Physocladia obscura]